MSEDTLPPVLACVENALLPETYKHAVDALARCESLDECKSWSDKAAALSSYAKQADDPDWRTWRAESERELFAAAANC